MSPDMSGWGLIGRLFDLAGYREEQAVKASALRERMAGAIGSVKNIAGYDAAKAASELDAVASERAHERTGEIARCPVPKLDTQQETSMKRWLKSADEPNQPP